MASKVVPFDALVALVGEAKALRLCKLYAGDRLPSMLSLLRRKRDQAIIADWIAGAQVGELAAKYALPRNRISTLVNTYVIRTVELPASPKKSITRV